MRAVDPKRPFCRIILNLWTPPAPGGQPVATQRRYNIGNREWEGYLKVWADDAALGAAVRSIVDEELADADMPRPLGPAEPPAVRSIVDEELADVDMPRPLGPAEPPQSESEQVVAPSEPP
jgi:hypothetical protein